MVVEASVIDVVGGWSMTRERCEGVLLVQVAGELVGGCGIKARDF